MYILFCVFWYFKVGFVIDVVCLKLFKFLGLVDLVVFLYVFLLLCGVLSISVILLFLVSVKYFFVLVKIVIFWFLYWFNILERNGEILME